MSKSLIHRLDILTLQLFVAIVEERSIAKAAARQNITNSAVSKRISDLEDFLGIKLLRRHHRGVEPTEAGRTLLHHAHAVLSNIAQLESELRDFANGTRGFIRVYANESTAISCLPGDLSTFLTQNPMVRMEFQVVTSPLVLEGVLDNAADIGIFTGDLPTGSLKIYPYYEDKLSVLAPKGHPLHGRGSVRFEEIIGFDLIGSEPNSSIENLMQRAASQLGQTLNIRIRVGGFDAACEMVGAGLGLAVVIETFGEKMAKVMDIDVIGLDEPWATRLHKLCVRNPTNLPFAARLLVEHLRSRHPVSKAAIAVAE